MPIKISKTLIAKLPVGERTDFEEYLINKAGGVCNLCDGGLNLTVDTLVADHDIPEAEGGPTVRSNLNLVHKECNNVKLNSDTADVRPYLKFTRLLKSKGGIVHYNQAIDVLGIEPKAVVVQHDGKSCTVHLPDGKADTVRVFSERNKAGEFEYCYIELPKEVIFNDHECQPRTIKPPHLWNIYMDLARNPLHEPPGCRLSNNIETKTPVRIMMFDGQHKSLACWLLNRKSICVKLYLSIDRAQTIALVNSIQSKIKKLPLSPFELSAKMTDEWKNRVAQYEMAMGGPESASEAGFLKWVDKDLRSRAKTAFEDALIQSTLDREGFQARELIARQGMKADEYSINEAAFKNKVLKQMLYLKPLDESFVSGQAIRDRESEVIVRLLNFFHSYVFDSMIQGREMSEREKSRAKRVLFQSALQYIVGLMRSIVNIRLRVELTRAFIARPITEEDWQVIEGDIRRMLDHPIWTVDLNKNQKTSDVLNALQKNQSAEKAFGQVCLDVNYVLNETANDCIDER